jgi:hypothetical protein
VPLGRKWPNGLVPDGPRGRSPENLPEQLKQGSRVKHGPRWSLMGQGPCVSPHRLVYTSKFRSGPELFRVHRFKRPPPRPHTKCTMVCPGHLGAAARQQGSCLGLPGPCTARHNTQEDGARGAAYGLAGQKLGCGTALGCAGRARTRARGLVHGARRVHPVAGGALDATDEARRGALC